MGEQLTPAQLLEVVRAERRRRWEQGDRIPAEEFLRRYPALQAEPAYALELVYHEKLLRRELGERPALDEYLQRFPQFTTQLRAVFEVDSWLSASPLEASAAVGTESSTSVTPVEHEGELPPLPCIPGYEILGRLGRGGVGVVYKALQERLNRLVALKMLLVAAHADAAQVARFRAEAEAQARVQHPNIVQIFEVGEADGWPYLALEFVDGGGLADRLDGTPQPVRWTAELVETLARAMQHAHQRGLVHRDLKPANVLLSADGTPKISDFGLAKRVQEGAGSPTHSGDILGTPSYMAPEQAAGEMNKVGPAADVYALGAILYELLTGRPPFLGANALETLLQVRQQEPVPPRRLLPSVPRDLETITLKCLRKEPARRYATADALADDLKRFRHGEPIVARPVGSLERGVKWAQRQPAAAALIGVAVLLLVGGAAGVLWYAKRERNRADREGSLREHAEHAEKQALAEKENAKRSAAEMGAVLEFFQERVLAAARPKDTPGGLGKDVALRAAVDAAVPGIEQAFAGQATVEASIRFALGQSYMYLGEPVLAVLQFERALMQRREVLGPTHPDTLASMGDLAEAYEEAGRSADALPLFEEVLTAKKIHLGPDHPSTLTTMANLGFAYREAGQPTKALPLIEEALQGRQAKLGPDHPDTLGSLDNLALAYWDAGRLDEAIRLHERALNGREIKLGRNHVDTLATMSNLAQEYQAANRLPDALPLLEQVLAGWKDKLGPDHPRTLTGMNNLALAYQAGDRLADAVRLFEEALKSLETKFEPDHPFTLSALNNLALAYQAADRLTDALPRFEKALKGRRAKLGPDHPHTLDTTINLGWAYLIAGRPADALPLTKEALERGKVKFGQDHPSTVNAMGSLAAAYLATEQPDKAIPLFHDYLAAWRKRVGRDHPNLAIRLSKVGAELLKHSQFADAEKVLREGLTIGEAKQPDAWHTFNVRSMLGASLLGQQKYAEAEPLLVQGYEGMRARENAIPPQAKTRLTEALERVVRLYNASGKPEQAAIWRQKLEQAKAPTNPTK
jgi:tetratricopeptide (TPR) repeat protein